MRTTARALVSAVALVTVFSPFLADYNATHLFNPAWPPHAKFHDAITMQLGALLGLLALALLWWRAADPVLARANFVVAALVASFYWVALIGADFFPGTSYVDPEFAAELPLVAGVLAPQVLLAGVLLVLLVSGEVLWRRGRHRSTSAGEGPALSPSRP